MFPPSVPRFLTWTSATVAATSARIGRLTSTSDEPMIDASVAIAPISSVVPETEIVRSSSSFPRSTSTSGEAARCFITLTSVWPPARARAPSCSERRRRPPRRWPDARTRPLAAAWADSFTQRRADMSRIGTVVASPRGRVRRRSRRVGDQHAHRRRPARPGRLERVRAGALRPARRGYPDGVGLHAPRLHPRGDELVAPALHGLGCLRGARRRAAPARARVREHRPHPPPPSPTGRRCSSRPRWRRTSPSSTLRTR